LVPPPLVNVVEHLLIESYQLLDGIQLWSPPRHADYCPEFEIYVIDNEYISYI